MYFGIFSIFSKEIEAKLIELESESEMHHENGENGSSGTNLA